jgi:hypothetical protein
MRRLNVRQAQIDECIRSSMFALSERPQNPELQPGELLLLQLVKTDAIRLGKLHERINFALVFERIERDYDGSLSRKHWPDEGRVWNWIVYGLATIPTIPFSLEDLGLSQDYGGQTNPRYIKPQDEQVVRQFIQWSLAQSPQPSAQLVEPRHLAETFGQDRALTAIYNHDRIEVLHPTPKRETTTDQHARNPWLADALKSYYRHQCQVCGNDFEPRYGAPFSETHHIHYLSEGGLDISGNMLVVCPNHHRIIHVTHAEFRRETLEYQYPNGLTERLILPDHLVQAPAIDPSPKK